MKKQKLKTTHASLQVIIVIAIAVIINIVLMPLDYRVDLTENKIYTLTDATEEVVKNLDDIVTIKAYFSEELPSDLISVKQEVGDVLSEYENLSNNKIQVTWIDPKDDQEKKNEAVSLGIPELQFNVLEKDAFQVTTGFAGLAILYEDKSEAIPAIESATGLEYDLTAAITKITKENLEKVAILQGKGEKDITYFIPFLEKQYEVDLLVIDGEQGINDEINTLVIPGATQEFDEKELYAIDQFVMHGGGLIVLHDSIDVDNSLQPIEVNTGLNKMLEKYGIHLNNNVVVDPVFHENVTFGGGMYSVVTGYPFWVRIIEEGLQSDSVFTNKLQSLVLPWAQTISIDSENATILVQTSSNAYVQESPYNLMPQQEFSSEETSAQVVSAEISGELSSAYDVAPEGVNTEHVSETQNAKVIVVGDSDFIREEMASQFGDNALFFANLVDGVTQDGSLNTIRIKEVVDRPLKEVSEYQKALMRYGNIASGVVLVIVLGLVQWQYRKKQIKKIQEIINTSKV